MGLRSWLRKRVHKKEVDRVLRRLQRAGIVVLEGNRVRLTQSARLAIQQEMKEYMRDVDLLYS